MPIEYSSSPEYARRQPAARTLTDAQALELNNRQALLLPELNIGNLSGRLEVVAKMTGKISVVSQLDGVMSLDTQLSGILNVTANIDGNLEVLPRLMGVVDVNT